MKILVTGSGGFIGKNLIAELKNRGYGEIFEYDVDSSIEQLENYIKQCDFIFHLAGVNRPKDDSEFEKGNTGFTRDILVLLEEYKKNITLLMTSSTQALLNNAYGKSKHHAESLVFAWEKRTGNKAYIYRLSNVFGKWCRPNYNSVVATFCNNIMNGLPVQINEPDRELNLVYIDDVVDEFINALNGNVNVLDDGYCHVRRTFLITVQKLADIIKRFSENRKTLVVPDFEDILTKFLYATYMSYSKENTCSYLLDMKHDRRGWLAEFIKSKQFGQIFVSKTKPGIKRGEHWHHTKGEKFLVIHGKALIKLRYIHNETIMQYEVSGEELRVLDIPPGFTHSITNIGNKDVITLFWSNELFNPEKPDTYYLEV